MQTELQLLRPLLPTEPDHRFLDFFDDLMLHHEFGLALHAVCDYILDPNSPKVSEATVDQVDRLHAAMKIDDQCVEQLKKHKLI